MTFYDVEIDQERLHDEAPDGSGSRSQLEIQQSYSMLSSQFSESGSETSLGGLTDDEASILYSMESRAQPGLRQICEVSMKDELPKINEDQERVQVDDQIKDIEEISHKPHKSAKSNKSRSTNKDAEKHASSSTRTKVIACVLAVALSLTVMLIALLVNHATSDAKSELNDLQTQAPQVVVIPDVTSETSKPSLTVAFAPSDTMPIPAPSASPTASSLDAYSYLLNYISSFTKREFLLDTSRPQGRAFLQVVMDNKDSFKALSHSKILQTYAVLTLYFATSPKTWDSSFAWTETTSDICSWNGVVNCLEIQNGEKVVDGIALSYVGLSGTLPEEICLLEHLERLDLRSNNLSGIIPDCLSSSASLKTLLLSDNSFTGYLPSGILLVPTLEELGLSNNSLLGGLDTMIEGTFVKNVYRYGETWQLRRLNIENNLFSGAVPAFFGAFGSLKSLTLHGNDLTGEADEDLCGRTQTGLTELTADCREVVCTCCTTCY